jgi:hypothetical protein
MNTTSEVEIEIATRSSLKLYLFLVFAIVSIFCTIYLFYHFLTNHRLRHSLNNHVIFLLLLITFLTITIPLPFTIYFFAYGYSLIQTDTFCSIWNWLQYSFCLSNLCLMTLASFERHLFIFHYRLYQSKFYRIVLHYLPMIICLIYPISFYAFAIFITPCTATYDYTYIFCIWPCYYNNGYWLGYYDLIINNCSTNFLIPFLSVILLIRVMKQKHRMRQQAFKWRRDRKMLLQLLSISILYVIFWLPNNFVSLIEVSIYVFFT